MSEQACSACRIIVTPPAADKVYWLNSEYAPGICDIVYCATHHPARVERLRQALQEFYTVFVPGEAERQHGLPTRQQLAVQQAQAALHEEERP